MDGLSGFPWAIEAVYPYAEIQKCIIHQIRKSTKYVSYKDLKKLMADLKAVYSAPDEQTALANLEAFGDKWNAKYPKIYIPGGRRLDVRNDESRRGSGGAQPPMRSPC